MEDLNFKNTDITTEKKKLCIKVPSQKQFKLTFSAPSNDITLDNVEYYPFTQRGKVFTKDAVADTEHDSIMALNNLLENMPIESNSVNLCDYITKAFRYNDKITTENPYGHSIAGIILSNNSRAIFNLPNSSVSFDLIIPLSSNILLETFYGYHPLARNWGGDGARMHIEVTENGRTEEILNDYVMPAIESQKTQILLNRYAGKEIKLKFSVTNDNGKNDTGDWLVWVDPTIIVKD